MFEFTEQPKLGRLRFCELGCEGTLQFGQPGTEARVRLTISERATVNARFAKGEDVSHARWQVEPGTWTLEHALPSGRYAYELWAVDAMGNRSSTYPGEVTISG